MRIVCRREDVSCLVGGVYKKPLSVLLVVFLERKKKKWNKYNKETTTENSEGLIDDRNGSEDAGADVLMEAH